MRILLLQWMLHEVVRGDFEVFQVRGTVGICWFFGNVGVFGVELKFGGVL